MSMGRPSAIRRRTALSDYSLHFGPNMTPMVDVVMVILVFFMVSAAFVGPEWFLRSMVPKPVAAPSDAKPPEKTSGTSSPDEGLRLGPTQLYIRLLAGEDGRVRAQWLTRRFASIDELLQGIAQFADGVPREKIEVFLEPQGAVPYREVVRVHEACENLGIKRVGVVVR